MLTKERRCNKPLGKITDFETLFASSDTCSFLMHDNQYEYKRHVKNMFSEISVVSDIHAYNDTNMPVTTVAILSPAYIYLLRMELA